MRVCGRVCGAGAVRTSLVCALSDGCDACVYRYVIGVEQGGVAYLTGGTFSASHCSFTNNQAVR